MIWLVLVVVLGTAVIAAVLTLERWLLWILNGLDGLLARMGFGKWTARMLTAMEDWAKSKWGRRAAGPK
jgi:hypothetical protein